ncbi:MAG: hypothetical protein NUV57_06615 [archaeon]|nr:hypothetical protein [archaeon]
MLFIEFFLHLLTFDFGWIVQLVLNNLLWVFGLSALAYLIFGEKKFFAGFILLVFDIWLFDVFGVISGVSIFSATTLSLYYITKIAVLAFAENSTALKDKFVVISTLQGIIAIFVAQFI